MKLMTVSIREELHASLKKAAQTASEREGRTVTLGEVVRQGFKLYSAAQTASATVQSHFQTAEHMGAINATIEAAIDEMREDNATRTEEV